MELLGINKETFDTIPLRIFYRFIALRRYELKYIRENACVCFQE